MAQGKTLIVMSWWTDDCGRSSMQWYKHWFYFGSPDTQKVYQRYEFSSNLSEYIRHIRAVVSFVPWMEFISESEQYAWCNGDSLNPERVIIQIPGEMRHENIQEHWFFTFTVWVIPYISFPLRLFSISTISRIISISPIELLYSKIDMQPGFRSRGAVVFKMHLWFLIHY